MDLESLTCLDTDSLATLAAGGSPRGRRVHGRTTSPWSAPPIIRTAPGACPRSPSSPTSTSTRWTLGIRGKGSTSMASLRVAARGGWHDDGVLATDLATSQHAQWDLVRAYIASYAEQQPIRKVTVVGNAPLAPDPARVAETGAQPSVKEPPSARRGSAPG